MDEYGWTPSPNLFLNNEFSQHHGILHKVAPDETLYHISRKYHVPLSSLLYENPYVDMYNLKPQDEIIVPTGTI